MPISVECPECGNVNRFSDEHAGKTRRCKSCRAPVQVRKRKGSSRKKKPSGGNGLLIGGIAGGAVVVIIIAVVFLTSGAGNNEQLADSSPQDSTKTADNTATPSDSPGEASTDSSNGTGGDTTTPAELETTAQSSFNPPSESGFGTPSAASSANSLSFEIVGNWSVSADPPPGAIAFEKGKPLRVKVPKESLRGAGMIVPAAPSSVVAIRTGKSTKHQYEIHDSATGEEIGSTPSPGSSPVSAVSEDGSYLATTLAGAKQIEVYDVKAKKSLGTLSTSESEPFQVATLAIWNHRLVALSNVHKGIMVWEIPSGNLLHKIKGGDKFNSDYGHSFSPGGRYVAVDGQFLEKTIEVYDLNTGELAGSITPSGEVRVNDIEAIGFSRDGTQLAAIYGVDIYSAPARKYSRMVVWDVESAKSVADFEIEPRLKEQLEPIYNSHELESLPDGTRWLVHSLGIVDVSAKKLIYSFPKQEGVDLVPARRVMGADWILSATTDEGDPRLTQTEFTQEELLAGAAAAEAGGLTSDANLPPLTSTDFSQAADALATNQWTATADPLDVSKLPSSISVSASGTVRELALSRSESPVAVVRAGIQENLNDPLLKSYEQTRKIYAERGLEYPRPDVIAEECELIAYSATGEQVGKTRIPYSVKLRAVSASKQLVVVEEHRTNGRLDLYDISGEGKHVAGWRPYRSEGEKKDRELKQVDFIGAGHIATLSAKGVLVVWSIPDLKPIWKSDEVLDFALSPAGKFVAAIRGNSLGAKELVMLSALTGDGAGTLEFSGFAKSLAFHPNGELLAVSIDAEANKTIRILDVTEGQTIEEFPVPAVASQLTWTGTDYLLLNGEQLVSRPLQSVVWSYDSNNVVFPENQISTDLSLLHVTRARTSVRTLQTPSESVAAKLDPTRLANQALLKPGDTVKLNVQTSSDEILKPISIVATSLVEKQLEVAKTNIDAKAGIELSVLISSKEEGTVSLSKIGDRSVTIPVTRKSIQMDFNYSKQGKVIWSSSRRMTNLDRILVRLKQGQSAQDAIDELMLTAAEAALGNIKLPTYIFSSNASKGLGTSSLFE